MQRCKSASIMDSFEALEYPRTECCQRHQLLDIIVLTSCAALCCTDSRGRLT